MSRSLLALFTPNQNQTSAWELIPKVLCLILALPQKDITSMVAAIRGTLERMETVKRIESKHSQFFQCSQAIEGAVPQQGDLVVAQVPVKGQQI